jgi:hypothetical protein
MAKSNHFAASATGTGTGGYHFRATFATKNELIRNRFKARLTWELQIPCFSTSRK